MEKRKMLTVASTETRALDCYLDVALLGRPEGALLEAHVLWTVEDDCVLLSEGYGRHGVGGGGGGCGRVDWRTGGEGWLIYRIRV